jgi:hypothetical protein
VIGDLFNDRFGDILDDLGATIRAADIPEKVGSGMAYAIPKVADAFVSAAPGIAWSFLDAWLHADAWTKLLTFVAIAGKFGMFGKVGRSVAGPFVEGFVAGMGGKAAQEKLTTAGTAAGKVFGPAFAAGALLGLGLLISELNKKLHEQEWYHPPGGKDSFWDRLVPKTDNLKDFLLGTGGPRTKYKPSDLWNDIAGFFGSGPKKRQAGMRQSGGTALGAGPYVVGESGPELAWLPSGSRIESSVGGVVEVNVYPVLDGKILSRSVARVNADALARRGY